MRTLGYVLLFFILLTLQSCFDTIEQVFLNEDGSGNFQLTLNMSRSKTRLNSIMKMKTVNGHPVPSKYDISSKVKEVENTIARVQGISGVKSNLDFTNYIGQLSFNFQNISQVNQAVKNVYVAEDKKHSTENVYRYNPANRTLERLNSFKLKDAYKDLSNADKEIFGTANYTIINKFQGKVVATSNADAKVSPSGTAVMLKLNALDILTEKNQ